MMNYGLGNAMMQRDGAPQGMGLGGGIGGGMQGLPQGMFGNMGPQFNPSLAAAMGLTQPQQEQPKKRGGWSLKRWMDNPIAFGPLGMLINALQGGK